MPDTSSKLSVRDIEVASIYTIYNYIRFHILNDTTTSDLKRLFAKLFYVSLQSPSVISSFAEALNIGTLQSLETFADKNKMDVEKILNKTKELLERNSEIKSVTLIKKDVNTILDFYFEQTDKTAAENVLIRFTNISFEKEELMDNYIKEIKKLTKEQRGESIYKTLI
jgi:hypothetical protein